ncbi:MAG: lipocalin-like domain-containing protein [Acidobacteria bacterium]|nr:lipocalin-like domain-containing protein [Acidobacteriota bacterium]
MRNVTYPSSFLHKKLLSLAVIPALWFLWGVQSSAADPDIASRELVGTWRLVAYEDHLPDGTIDYPYGKNPAGLLIYDATGHMSIQIARTPQPKVAAGDDEKITPQEKIALFDSYVAYFGSYTVDWKRHVVTTRVEADLFGTFTGTTQERPFALQGHRLTLTPSWQKDGKTVQGVRVFERVR